MRRYRIKPTEIDAEQWQGWQTSKSDIQPFMSEDPFWMCPHCGGIDMEHGVIENLHGGYLVCPGDFIITDSSLEKYPCHPNVFSLKYDPV